MSNIQGRGIVLSLLAGGMAAFASLFAKIASGVEVEYFSKFCMLYMKGNEWIFQELFGGDVLYYVTYLTIFIRVISVCGIFLCNALMWTLFTKSLQCLPTLHATITNTASNFLLSAIAGKIIFGEMLPVLWWIGSLFVLMGLLLIHKGGKKDQDDVKKKS